MRTTGSPPNPGSEAAILLAIANHLIQTGRYDAAFVERWWNWQAYLAARRPDVEPTFEAFQTELYALYREYTFGFAAEESGVAADAIRKVAEVVAGAGTRLATHIWRSAAASNLHGWQIARCLVLLNALVGAVATEGGTFPAAWNKFIPRPIHLPPHPDVWNQLSWPGEYPLAMNEMSFLLPHLLKEGRGRLAVYFTRAYNPVWTNPDGFSWIEALTDEGAIGCHVALTPTWSETAFFADYILPMGHASERHDLMSYEQYDGQWVAFRQPVARVVRERAGETVADTRAANPGAVWEENEFWIELSWRIDPDGALGIRRYHESRRQPGTRLTVDEYYGWIFDHSVPGLPDRAAKEGLTPLEYMRRTGAFEIRSGVGAQHEAVVPAEELVDVAVDANGRVYTRAPAPASPNIVPMAEPDPDAEGRRPAGVLHGGVVRRGFPTPSGRLEFYSETLAAWGWPEHALPGYHRSHVHPENLEAGQLVLLSTFRLPTQIHTRSANAKWLDELAHTNPVWIHPADAGRLGIGARDLIRVETEIGYFVARPWITEGIRPGVVACSHHMGRWKPAAQIPGQGQMMRTVALDRGPSGWRVPPLATVGPYASADPDTERIWWTDVGVHQNLTFPVHPDPISGMHCWHQAVRVRRAEPGDRQGDIAVDSARAQAVYRRWLERARPAARVSPDGTRRPRWLLRPLKPTPAAYRLPDPPASEPGQPA